MKPIRVLIVEDSAVVREFLRQIISADPRLEVAGLVGTAEEALRVLDHIAPDVISLDIKLPGMQGFEATRRIMSQRPTPVVVVSASAASEELDLSMEALRAGALSVVEKPPAATRSDYELLADRLCTQLVIMSEVKVVRQRFDMAPALREPKLPRPLGQGPYRVLGITASTGGPAAIMELLRGLGAKFPLPILLVQHMTHSFIEGFGSWLVKVTPFAVEVVTGSTLLAPGKLYLAPPDRHLAVDGACAWAAGGDPVCSQRPSGNVLFSSMASSIRGAGLGILLTGMGEDGAQGLLALRHAGGYTITEDESTAVVYGMPAAGARLGAACEVLPLPAIAPRVMELVRGNPEGS